MWDLEYLLLFGLPNNKLELLDGVTPVTFPFPSRSSAEAHFDHWIEQLARWRNVPGPIARVQTAKRVEADVGNINVRLYHRPIRLGMPMAHQAWDWLQDAFWQRDLWDGQPAGFESGVEHTQRHWEAKLKLWSAIGDACDGRRVTHCGGVDLVLSDATVVAPDQCFYDKPKGDWMIGGDFYAGPPDLVAEVLSPPSRAIDRGVRKDLYAKAGVKRLWLLDPLTEVVERYELAGRAYNLVATHGRGERFRSELFGTFEFVVDGLFESQWPREGDAEADASGAEEPPPAWFMPKDMRLGLEYLFLVGHPERRYEIWDNQSPCVLAFGSEDESILRFRHFIEDACRWEGVGEIPEPTTIEPGIETVHVGRFHLVRRNRHVRLHVTVDARKFRALLETSATREGWDWGESES
jgi:Uma2 family endonuclease